MDLAEIGLKAFRSVMHRAPQDCPNAIAALADHPKGWRFIFIILNIFTYNFTFSAPTVPLLVGAAFRRGCTCTHNQISTLAMRYWLR
ncbi:MAG: hypothetical protein V7L04_21560 [Nostoc sp.]|uniref:hypothetical protein n=1 Tax=Nostoc sp. TaxID=1180 RepID=UPI002FFB8AE4